MLMVPYKSVAAALILAVFFGPIGVFYSSFLGGIIMSIFGLVAIGTMASMHSPLPMATVCLLGIVWSMAAVRLYNRKMLKIAINKGVENTDNSVDKKPRKKLFHFKKIKKTKATVPETEENASSWKI